jgi:SAM-dependent methyltransferase
MIKIRSPRYEQSEITLPQNVAQLNVAFNGELCSSNGESFEIKRNIIDLLKKDPEKLSPAEYSNFLSITASVYEDVWRTKSLGLITGHDFPIEREMRYLYDWVEPKPNQLIVDLGCSTALYARKLKAYQSASDVIALDFSIPMLEEARKRADADNCELYLVRADARKQPFFSEQVDAIVCGGTLNEFSEVRKVLFECKRVLKPNGRFFLMHLLEAETWWGKGLQLTAKGGGVQFHSKSEINELFEEAGFQLLKQHTEGIVCFSLLTTSA